MKKENSSHYKRSKKLKACVFGQYTLNAIGIIVLCYGVYEAACLFLNYKRCETSNDGPNRTIYIANQHTRTGICKESLLHRTPIRTQRRHITCSGR